MSSNQKYKEVELIGGDRLKMLIFEDNEDKKLFGILATRSNSLSITLEKIEEEALISMSSGGNILTTTINISNLEAEKLMVKLFFKVVASPEASKELPSEIRNLNLRKELCVSIYTVCKRLAELQGITKELSLK